MVKNPPANEGDVGSYPLEKEMATHSSINAWEISWTEEPGGLQCIGCKELDTTEQVSMHVDTLKDLLSCIN